MDYINIHNECEFQTIPRIGGGASLPLDCAWPKDKRGDPMLHLMTLSSHLVNTYSACRIPENYCVSVFIPYGKESNGHVVDLARHPDTARIIAHEIGAEVRQECSDPLSPPYSMLIDSDPGREDEDEFSDEIEPKIGGRPTWLQDVIESPGKQFFLQLLASQFNKLWVSHRGMFMGGVVYLFIDQDYDATAEQFGQLTVQYT